MIEFGPSAVDAGAGVGAGCWGADGVGAGVEPVGAVAAAGDGSAAGGTGAGVNDGRSVMEPRR